MPFRPRRTGSWLVVAWVAGTIAAIVIAVFAVNLAGAKVTARPMASLSRSGVEQALAGDATVLVRDDDSGGSDVSTTVDDHGGAVPGSDDSPGSGSGSASSSGPGGGSSGSGSDDGVSGSSGGSGSDDGGSGGGSGSPTTTDHEDGHDGTTTTTAVAPSAPATKTVSGNSVTIRCTGDTIALLSATAASGFSKEVDKSGPQEVKVQFAGDATDTEFEIQATCSRGVVRWS